MRMLQAEMLSDAPILKRERESECETQNERAGERERERESARHITYLFERERARARERERERDGAVVLFAHSRQTHAGTSAHVGIRPPGGMKDEAWRAPGEVEPSGSGARGGKGT